MPQTNICLATALLRLLDHEDEVHRIHRIVGKFLPVDMLRSPEDVMYSYTALESSALTLHKYVLCYAL